MTFKHTYKGFLMIILLIVPEVTDKMSFFKFFYVDK
jgi:hypothetical protein